MISLIGLFEGLPLSHILNFLIQGVHMFVMNQKLSPVIALVKLLG